MSNASWSVRAVLSALLISLGYACGQAADSPPPATTPVAGGAAPAAAGSSAGSSGASASPTAAVPDRQTNPAGSSAGSGSPGPAADAPATPAADSGAAGSGSAESGGAPAAEPAAAGAGGDSAMAEPPPVECDPADRTPEAELVPIASIADAAAAAPVKGPHMPVIEHDPGLATHTVYRPMDLEGTKYPIVVWANGGCVTDGTMFSVFLLEITSHGFVIVADGEPNGSGMGPLETNGEPQKQAIDWIVAENERPCSRFYRKLDTTKIAAMGQSCGGLMTMGVSGDPRLTTAVIWNSGMFERDQMIYAGLHTPMAYFIGGPDDVAYPQAEDDFAAIETVPLFYGNLPVGHLGTYAEDNGGEFGRVGIGWLKWHLYGDQTESGAKMFVGADCGLCQGTMWTILKKMME
jgi:hypothetical protein